MTRFAIFIVFLFLSLAVILPLNAVLAGTLARYEAVRTVAEILLFAWVLMLLYLAHTTASHMVLQNMGFGSALKLSIAEARVAVGFLPVIGRWFGPKVKRAPDDPID